MLFDSGFADSHSNTFTVYMLVRFFSPESKGAYATTRSTLALFSTYLVPFLAHGLFTTYVSYLRIPDPFRDVYCGIALLWGLRQGSEALKGPWYVVVTYTNPGEDRLNW